MSDFGNVRALPLVEKTTKSSIGITSDHAAIHLGRGFSASVVGTGVADNGSVQIEFRVPAGVYPHVKRIEAEADALALIEVIESPTLTTGNTALAAHNRNRAYPVASACTLKSDPTSVSNGTVLEQGYFGTAGGGAAKSPSQNRSQDQEFVLCPGKTYLFRLTNKSGSGSKTLSLWIFWYEEGSY